VANRRDAAVRHTGVARHRLHHRRLLTFGQAAGAGARVRPLILITNDDGLRSPGIRAVAEAVAHLGDLLLVAPHEQQTTMSRAMPRGAEVGVIETIDLGLGEIGCPVYSVVGSPAQAVSHAILELAPRCPDLCISGINYGENLGSGISRSGTIGAALEANSYGIPGLAISLGASLDAHHSAEYRALDWRTAMHFTRLFAEKILTEGLPGSVALLNVNIPPGATPETEVRLTRQSRQA
jgi:5'-nucleotidase